MKNKSIVILGDSTSMSIGAERKSYPFILSDMKSWSSDLRIINCSMPGITSTDACAFFFKNLSTFDDVQTVIVYLGNCDTMSSELNKGSYTYLYELKDKVKNSLNISNKKVRLKNRLLHYEWNQFYDRNIEAAVSQDDFKFNLSRIINYCDNKNIPVVLVRPIAHKHFPSGSGKGNFAFYHYFDIADKVANLVSIEDKRIKDAMKLYGREEYKAAAEKYKEILSHTSELSSTLEYQSLVVNNYAVCKAIAGEFTEANYLLNLMLGERGSRKDIILYNMALIAKEQGNEFLYNQLLNDSYEIDDSMYRIREPYKMAIDEIANKYKNVKTIDQSNFFIDKDFVDHCHLLPAAQKEFAALIFEKICTEKIKGNNSISIVNTLYNPEYGLGNNQSFHDYFKSFSTLTSSEIHSYIKGVFKSVSKVTEKKEQERILKDIPSDMKYAIEYYQRHPCFSRLYDIVRVNPFHSTDIGRFPEYFIIRFMIPYVKKIEAASHLSVKFTSGFSLLRSSDELLSILPNDAKGWVNKEIPVYESDYTHDWLETIITNARKSILSHLEQGNQISNRLKGTIFWYFRETLRFGSHSRVSMRYERVTLEFITESLAVALVIDEGLNSSKNSEICNLIKIIEDITKIHEKYCSLYNPEMNNSKILKEYDHNLSDFAVSLKNIVGV